VNGVENGGRLLNQTWLAKSKLVALRRQDMEWLGSIAFGAIVLIAFVLIGYWDGKQIRRRRED
jgi:hypothetical protein